MSAWHVKEMLINIITIMNFIFDTPIIERIQEINKGPFCTPHRTGGLNENTDYTD
jgi:hypothetical protein